MYRHRPHGALRHYAGLLGPTGAVAGRVAAERDLPLRVARLKDAARTRRAPIEPMRALVAGPGGRLRWRAARAPGLIADRNLAPQLRRQRAQIWMIGGCRRSGMRVVSEFAPTNAYA